MIATLEEVKAAIVGLSDEDRAELELFLQEVQDDASGYDAPLPPNSLTGDEWLADLQRRSDEIDSRIAVLTPWEIVRERVSKRVFGTAHG
jgi:hypothetical protein